tara:strand:+ start:17788 stop:18534 length:747 start_codon:yes stop_codon:yes gene_type:complete
MKFDLIIQGPLDKTSIEKVDDVSDQFENVIISHWSENDSSLLEGISSKNVSVCAQPTPDRSKTVGVMKDSTFFYSISSTYLGLQKCESEYVVKMRGDEIYTDFLPLKERFLQDTGKFVFGNIFAKPWSQTEYHIGDHLFAARTELLTKCYEMLYKIYTRKGNLVKDSWAIQGYPSHQTAETILAKSFIKARNIPKQEWSKFATFKNNFDVVDICSLGLYVANWKHGNTVYSSKNNPFEWPIKTLEDMR